MAKGRLRLLFLTSTVSTTSKLEVGFRAGGVSLDLSLLYSMAAVDTDSPRMMLLKASQ
jgi:hypothetical protein